MMHASGPLAAGLLFGLTRSSEFQAGSQTFAESMVNRAFRTALQNHWAINTTHVGNVIAASSSQPLFVTFPHYYT
jgi:hypothetical protein